MSLEITSAAVRDLCVRQFPRVGFRPAIETGLETYCLIVNPKSAFSLVRRTLWAAEFKAGRISEPPPADGIGLHAASNAIFRRIERERLGAELSAGPRLTMVRNPYTRLLTCYLEKIAGNRPFKKFILYDLGLDHDEPISFETFVGVVCRQDSRDMDAHWAPQAFLTQARDLRYDLVGAVERIGEDMAAMLEIAGLPPHDIVGHLPDRTQTAAEVAGHYTPEIAEMVRQRYAADFALFNYSTDLADACAPPARALREGTGTAGAGIPAGETVSPVIRTLIAAWELSLADRRTEALDILRAAMDADSGTPEPTPDPTPELAIDAGEICLELGDLDAAEAHIRHAIAGNGTALRYRLALVDCLLRQGNAAAAQEIAEAARETAPGRPRVLRMFAQCLEQRGDTETADAVRHDADRFEAMTLD